MSIFKKISRVWKNEKGQSMTEYILLVALIAIALIGTWKIFGGKIAKLIGNAGSELEKAGNVDYDENSEGK